MEESTMVLERARSHLEALAKVSAELNEASDKYTEELKAIDARLKELNVGIEIRLGIPMARTDWQEEEDRETEVTKRSRTDWHLGYGKHGSTWSLLVYEYCVEQDGTQTLVSKTPLLDASRDLRIDSADDIMSLLAEIGRVAKEKTEALRNVTDKKK